MIRFLRLPGFLLALVLIALAGRIENTPRRSLASLDAPDSAQQQAIDRLNLYRRAAGLRELAWDPEMSAMAQAHADYYSRNCLNKSGYHLGHFEEPQSPDFTAGGDEAAKTSGLGFNARTPLQALEILMSLPYHRTQLLEAGAEKVGVGFSDRAAECRIGLFMTRRWIVDRWNPQLPSEGHVPGGSSLIVFPPADMTGIPTLFNPAGEMPDPRPAPHSRLTGYPVTLRIADPQLLARIQSVQATITDSTDETGVPLWISHPRDPAVPEKSAPGQIYQGSDQQAGTSWIGRNHESIFLLPQRPLRADTAYRVEVQITSQAPNRPSEVRRLSWSFRTAPTSPF